MANTLTAITKQDVGGWIGWIEKIPGVNCQEETWEELIGYRRSNDYVFLRDGGQHSW